MGLEVGAFDAAAYERDVLRPLRGRSGALPEDLLLRYGMPRPLAGPELAAHLKAVRSYWTVKAGGAGNLARLCQLLQAEDARLSRAQDLTSAAFWVSAAGERDRVSAGLIAELAADLRRQYAGGVTREQLDRLPARYRTLTPGQRDRAAADAGVRIITTIALPVECGLTPSQLGDLDDKLGRCGARSVVALLIPGVNEPFRLIGGLAVPGSPSLKLSRGVVKAARQEAEALGNDPGAQARRAAVRLVDHAVEDGADPLAIALAHFVHLLTETGGGGAFTVREATDRGLHPEDAEVLAASLAGHRAAPDTATPAKVLEYLGKGRLRAAQQALQGVPSDVDGRAPAAEAVDAAQARLDALLARLEGAEPGSAETATMESVLRQAAAIAADDPAIAAMLARVPPPPVTDLSAREHDGAAELSWRMPPTGFAELTYRVVRTTRVPARAPHEGRVVATTTASRATDRDPRPGHAVLYTVFATGGAPAEAGTAWSPPVTASLRLLPPAAGVTGRSRDGESTVSWHLHPAASRVSVHRTADAPPREPGEGVEIPAGQGGCTDFGLEADRDYFYAVTAWYRDEDGGECAAPAAVAAVSTRAKPLANLAPVTGLSLEPRPDGLLVAWVWPPGTGLAEVTAGGVTHRVTQSRYTTEGGFLVPLPRAAAEIEVRTVRADPDGDVYSTPVAARHVPAAVTVAYRAERAGGLLRGRRWRISVTADGPCAGDLVVVAAPGVVMPVRPDPAQVVGRLRLRPGESTVEVRVPDAVGKRYWLRCFLDGAPGARLHDPPLSTLRVS
ncbi:hypothetical protein Afil01_40410 [Actinorhabdospora filicis]|uniref:Fibronectin type-III domain-containing protein n=1 Tax=Actinorhabdospora filicis TaxID=1785913 RepID=A0A9W6WA30_9ACTN|nr:hypothetical protein [Actinorhabdospora filicis]GLZ79234.1 hypothetical protein Afil01_40410 [Actinorhabdospora filicis]